MTSKIYAENHGVPRTTLRERLRAALGVERLIIIPKEPYDMFGHSDGMVRFIDSRTVLVNRPINHDMLGRKLRPHYEKVSQRLRRHGLTPIEFPYQPTEGVNAEGTPSAKGCYINFLQTSDKILLPVFGEDADKTAKDILRHVLPGTEIIPVRCDGLAEKGGLLNCVTWNVSEPT